MYFTFNIFNHLLLSFLGTLQSLPLTAYMKMVDLWLLCLMLYPFIVVILLTLREFFTKTENKVQIKSNTGSWSDEKGYKIQLVSCVLAWGLPLLVCLFIILYWLTGLWHRTNQTLATVC